MAGRISVVQSTKLTLCRPTTAVPLTPRRRRIHSSSSSKATATAPRGHAVTEPTTSSITKSPYSILPLSSVLRTYMITRVSSSPAMLKACFALMKRMLVSKSFLLSPERNVALHWIFKKTFYAQFCAGENRKEVQRHADQLKTMGYSGIILEYALEVLEGDVPSAAETEHEIEVFRRGMHDTIAMAEPGDFIGMKWSGLGREALHRLSKNLPPTPAMQSCIDEICDAAKAKGTRFLPGAEEESTGVNNGVDSWSTNLMKKYNKDEAFMYNTYQCYLKSTPTRIAQLLMTAEKEGFVPGIKPVRGAYLTSEHKSAVHGSWEETSEWYNGIVDALIKRQWNAYLRAPSTPPRASFPNLGVMLATHNVESIRKVQSIRDEQVRNGKERIELAYAQLQGMADDLSCELVAASNTAGGQAVDKPRPFKAATWGSVMDCMNFLLRRAFENQDAMGRTLETRKAMGREIRRRCMHTVGLS